jgi:cytochrome c oxidase cbb3-type subunit 3
MAKSDLSSSLPPTVEVLAHDYDGIQEYDNPLPKWWVYLFYGTIVFALVYVPYYHFGPGGLPRDAWAQSMNEWYQLHPPPKLPSDAELAAMAEDPTFVPAGAATFAVRCASCHGLDGGGLVGPNLTDDFSIYGYDRDQIVRIIYTGTPKGMLAWKDQLGITEIYQVGAYVRTLRGTTPAHPRQPEGALIP